MSSKSRTKLSIAPLKLTGEVKLANDIVTVGMIFPLNDLFESEEFDSPSDHYILRKKMQPHSLDLSPQIIANVRYFTFGQVFINFA
jgi:hypothetical protein